MIFQQTIGAIIDGKGVDTRLIVDCMKDVIEGRCTPSQTAAFLICLRIVEKDPFLLASLAKLMLGYAIPVDVRVNSILMDTCGTGGDDIKTINVSTASAIVVAACGGKVAKHGNRSFTGYSGSADFLEWIGVRIDAGPAVVKRCIEGTGFGFIFAPIYHPAMKNVAQIRRELGIRTTLNLLGPLTNPARPEAQAIGVFSQDYLDLIAEAARLIGLRRAAIYHGLGGMDEVSPFSDTIIVWLEDSVLRKCVVKPEGFGIKGVRLEDIVINDRRLALEKTLMGLLGMLGKDDPITSLLLMNSSVALMVAGIADDLKGGVELSWEAISSGKTERKLKEIVRESGGNIKKLEVLLDELS